MGKGSGNNGSQSKSSNGESSSSRDSIQQQINAEQRRIGAGNWNERLNELVRQRDNAGSGDDRSGGLAGLGTALRNAPSNIARDIRMGFNPSSRDADYYRRTAETIARTQGADAANRYISQMTQRGGIAAEGVQGADVDSSVNYGQRIGMLNQDGTVNTNYMGNNDGGSSSAITPAPEDIQSPSEQTYVNQALMNRMRMQQEQDARARNMEMARMMFERQNMMSPGPIPRQMQGIAAFRNPFVRPMQPPPEEMPPGFGGQGVQPLVDNMRAIPMPRYPQPMPMPRYPQPMPYNPASSPAFRYAAQNYGRLGGMQRTMPRPMEMMSQRERQQIGRMADSFRPQPMRDPYVGILQRGLSAKGGGRSGYQGMPSFMPRGFGGSMGRGML